MKNNSKMMEDNASAFVFMEYETPQMCELTDAVTVFGAGEGDMGTGSDKDFGAAFMEDHSGDYTDFNLDE